MMLFGRSYQGHGQFRHKNQGLGPELINALHQLPDIQATTAGHPKVMQGRDHHRAAHQQRQINPGDIFQQGGQRQDAQVPLKLDTVKTFLQCQRSGCHLRHRQANAFGCAGTARGEGDFRGLLRHPGPACRHRQML